MYTSSGVWQEMVKEVFKYIPSAPHTYMPGLEILSQLLPLPLPMQTQSLLTGNNTLSTNVANPVWVYIRTLKHQNAKK
jgi:hypothetical protein